jgi:hypothetical protein
MVTPPVGASRSSSVSNTGRYRLATGGREARGDHGGRAGALGARRDAMELDIVGLLPKTRFEECGELPNRDGTKFQEQRSATSLASPARQGIGQGRHETDSTLDWAGLPTHLRRQKKPARVVRCREEPVKMPAAANSLLTKWSDYAGFAAKPQIFLRTARNQSAPPLSRPKSVRSNTLPSPRS